MEIPLKCMITGGTPTFIQRTEMVYTTNIGIWSIWNKQKMEVTPQFLSRDRDLWFLDSLDSLEMSQYDFFFAVSIWRFPFRHDGVPHGRHHPPNELGGILHRKKHQFWEPPWRWKPPSTRRRYVFNGAIPKLNNSHWATVTAIFQAFPSFAQFKLQCWLYIPFIYQYITIL